MCEEKIEGYWYSEYDPQYPMPEEYKGEWDREAFLNRLIKVEETMYAEYEMVVKEYNEGNSDPLSLYYKKNDKIESYRGLSECRICKCANGSREFVCNGFRWPEGLRHYIEEHGVKPSTEFIDMIIRATY